MKNYKSVLAAVVATLIAVAASSVYAVDENRQAPNKPKAAGRALDETVKSGPVDKPGRALDDESKGTVKAPNKAKKSRAIEEGVVKSQGASEKASRAADQATK